MADSSELVPQVSLSPLSDLITFAIVSMNGEQELPTTLDSLLRLGTGCRIVVLDDGSSDGSCAVVRDRFPVVDLIACEEHVGITGLRKRAVDECRTPYLLLMDNDVTFAPGCVERLLQQLRDYPDALSCRPRLLYSNKPEIIYQDAATLHFLALAADQLRGRPATEGLSPFPRQTIGGGIMLLNCEIARKLGNFDENYLFGWSDGELDMRARLLGHFTLQDPYAIAYHIERLGGLRRVTGQLYNRRRFILVCYSTRTLLLLAPALLIFEFVVLAMCLASGYRQQYIEAWRKVIADWGDIRTRRRQLRSEPGRLGDGVVLSGGKISITGRMAGSRWLLWLSPVLSTVFGAYWRVVGPLIPGKRPC